MNTYKDWECPFCNEHLSKVDIVEFYQNVEEWTKYSIDRVVGKWNVVDSGSDNGFHHYLSCGGCKNMLPYEMYEEIFDAIL